MQQSDRAEEVTLDDSPGPDTLDMTDEPARFSGGFSGSIEVMPEPRAGTDQHIAFYGLDWSQYESMLVIRGERPAVRMTYLEGTLELMTPAVEHEKIKKCMARLIEAYAEEHDLDLNGHGAWSLRSERNQCGTEPDECYVLGVAKPIPDLVVDVAWTEGGLDKLSVYQRMGIPEAWVWTREGIEIHRLRSGGYVQVGRSELLPKIDLGLLARCILPDAQTAAVRAFREALRGDGPALQKPNATGPRPRKP
jgi:Uma2 family endonuclease